MVQLATVLGDQPSALLTAAYADPATLKAANRFFDNDTSAPIPILARRIRATDGCRRQAPVMLSWG